MIIQNLNKNFKRILVISDLQIPCQHRQAYSFLKKVKEKVKPDLVVQIGDLVDFGSISSFDTDPDYVSPSVELELVRDEVKKLSRIFPKLHVVIGNHEMRLFRKLRKAGLPSSVLKDFNEILGAPRGWDFSVELRLNWYNSAKRVRFIHTESGANRKRGMKSGFFTNLVHGHIHTDFSIQYTSTVDSLYWNLNVGCLIDDEAIVFNYNKQQSLRPIYGCGAIIDHKPILIPMLLEKGGKWNGKLSYI